MKGGSDLNGENIKEYFEDKLDSAIKSLKGYLYTVIGFLLSLLAVAIAALVFAGSVASGGNFLVALSGAGALGIVAIFVMVVMLVAHLVYVILSALKFGNLFSLLNSQQSLDQLVKNGGQKWWSKN